MSYGHLIYKDLIDWIYNIRLEQTARKSRFYVKAFRSSVQDRAAAQAGRYVFWERNSGQTTNIVEGL